MHITVRRAEPGDYGGFSRIFSDMLAMARLKPKAGSR
jgi:hypothetical protein